MNGIKKMFSGFSLFAKADNRLAHLFGNLTIIGEHAQGHQLLNDFAVSLIKTYAKLLFKIRDDGQSLYPGRSILCGGLEQDL